MNRAQSAGCAVSCLAQLTPRHGDVQAAATAEQADCWSQWPSKSHSGEDKGSAGGGERGMTTSRCLPVVMRGCSKLSSSGVKVQRVRRTTEQIIFCVSRETCSPSFCSGTVHFCCYFHTNPVHTGFYHELQHLGLIIHFSLPGVRTEVEAASWGSVSLCVLISTRLAPCVTLRCSCWMAVKQTKTSLEHTGEFLLLCLACFRGSGASCVPASLLKYGRSAPPRPFKCHPGQQNRKDYVQKQLE